MGLIRSLIIAFSMYSKIPMPRFKWEERDLKYALGFFPLVGVSIGLVIYGWQYVCGLFGIVDLCRILITVAIPLIITGGIHADGFMDTSDAFCSYQPRERKLEILKDPHIGAFAVISFAIYGLLYIAAFSQIIDTDLLKIICAGFFLSRILSGLAGVSFKGAKTEGMLFSFTSNTDKNAVRIFLLLQGILCIGFMIWTCVLPGLIVSASALLSLVWYYFKCKKELGGITGDTEGYFLLICQLLMALVAAGINIFWMM
ncbi:MAG: adenosylcobinamide-GDP ribazoletransferase [Lachnospiraceae bacterium]|nr:adenosylcobinamide-GDP ribazoletransferase [Lachnospiraceae bacterium]